VLGLACATGFWTFIFVHRIRRIKAGSLLLDMGLGRLGVCNLILVVILVVCIFYSQIMEVIDGNFGLEKISAALAWLSLGVYALFVGSGRIQIREHGVFYFRQLIRWETITGYRWEEGRRSVLSLKLDRRLPLFREVHLPVPARHRDSVDELLSQNVAL
jgi:uncharacterized membrane protein YobD (UPF0266 family)